MTTLDELELERLMRGALVLVRLGPLTKHEHQELDSLMTRAINALPALLESARRVERLEAALKPFADEGADPEWAEFSDNKEIRYATKLKLRDLRRARAALKGT